MKKSQTILQFLIGLMVMTIDLPHILKMHHWKLRWYSFINHSKRFRLRSRKRHEI